jgi:hypothetical protein
LRWPEKPRAPLPFERGEELVYQAEFTRGLLRSVDVAEFHFNSIPENVARGTGDPVVLHLTGDVFSKGLFPRIAGFKFHQHVESKADVEPFTALHTDKIEESGKRSRVLEAVFDHKAQGNVEREVAESPGRRFRLRRTHPGRPHCHLLFAHPEAGSWKIF